MSAFEIDSLKQEVSRLKRELASERAARREAEKPNPEIDRLKRELASAKQESSGLSGRPTSREINAERAARARAEKDAESLRTEIESKESDITRLKEEVGKLRSEAKGLRAMFAPGPDLEKSRLRDALKSAKVEMWRLRNVSNQQRDGGSNEPSDAVSEA